MLSGIEDGFVNVGAATMGKQDAALLSRVRVAQQGGGRGFAVGGKSCGAGSGEDGEADTEVGGVAGARLGGAGAAVVSVDIKGHGNVVSDATDVADVVPVLKTVVPNGVLGEVEVEAAPGNELLGAEAVQTGPGGGAEDTGGQAAGGDGEEVGGVGGGEVGGGGVGETVAEGEPATMEDGGRDDTLGFEALGLRGNCCKTPACQVGGVRG